MHEIHIMIRINHIIDNVLDRINHSKPRKSQYWGSTLVPKGLKARYVLVDAHHQLETCN